MEKYRKLIKKDAVTLEVIEESEETIITLPDDDASLQVPDIVVGNVIYTTEFRDV